MATRISGEVRRVAACTLRERPPTMSAARMSVNCASFVTMLCTCRHQHSISLTSAAWTLQLAAAFTPAWHILHAGRPFIPHPCMPKYVCSASSSHHTKQYKTSSCNSLVQDMAEQLEHSLQLPHLHCQLPRGREHERIGGRQALVPVQQPLQQRQRKGCSLPGSCDPA